MQVHHPRSSHVGFSALWSVDVPWASGANAARAARHVTVFMWDTCSNIEKTKDIGIDGNAILSKNGGRDMARRAFAGVV